MSHIVHVPLERLSARYTEYLEDMEDKAFHNEFNTVDTRLGTTVSTAIKKGRVLDSVNRPIYAMSQVIGLLTTPPPPNAPIYFSDFFTPGIEALRYAGFKNRMYAFLWAQTFDKFDFTTEMIEWMRPWEHMAFEIYEKVFVASPLLAELICTAIPSVSERLVVTGLPFDSEHARSLLDPKDISTTAFDGVYSSRFDEEKNPCMFLDLVEACPEQVFVICTGHSDLRGTDTKSVRRAQELSARQRSNLIIRTGLSRSEYYGILQASKAQINCADQDWVSFTLLEALTFDCVPVYPNHRSFPHALGYSNEYLYNPEDFTDFVQCFLSAIGQTSDRTRDNLKALLAPHNKALPTIAQIMSKESFL